ncbi:MAG: DNA gyrase modulator [PS1 clade bacterium]
MPKLEQTIEIAIDLLNQYRVSDYEISLSSSSGFSTSVRLGEVETLQYHLDNSFDIIVYYGQKKGTRLVLTLVRIV